MKKMLSEEQFKNAIKNMDVGDQTLTIAYGVLVEQKTQASYVSSLGVTKGAVWQAVQRVWNSHNQQMPPGYEKVEVVLPTHRAYIAKKWAAKVKPKKESK